MANISLPSSGGGIMRYSEELKSKIEIKPMVIIVAIIIIAILELYLYKFI